MCGPVTDNVDSDVRHMPEYLTVCAWRSVKEVSLLLGQLTSTAPVIDPSKVSNPDNEVTDVSSKVIDSKVVDSAENHDGLLTVDLVSDFCSGLLLVVIVILDKHKPLRHRSRIRYLSKKNLRILTNFPKLKKFVKIRKKIR